MNPVSLSVPATSANLGPGFDVLGVAVGLRNEVTFTRDGALSARRLKKVVVDVAGAGVDALPRDRTNLVVRAAEAVFRRAGRWPERLAVRLVNRIPLSRGLGSSSAAIVGGMAAANRLLGDPLTLDDLTAMAVAMEGHPDNVVPALHGGFCVSGLFRGRPRYWRLPVPGDLRAVVCVPEVPLPTKAARRVLPARVPLKDAVFTASRVAFWLGALLEKRYDWLGDAMEDVLHQPARARLIPGLFEVIAAARRAGACGAALSGAGSCVLALTAPGAPEKRVSKAMVSQFARRGVVSRGLSLKLENKGIRFL